MGDARFGKGEHRLGPADAGHAREELRPGVTDGALVAASDVGLEDSAFGYGLWIVVGLFVLCNVAWALGTRLGRRRRAGPARGVAATFDLERTARPGPFARRERDDVA